MCQPKGSFCLKWQASLILSDYSHRSSFRQKYVFKNCGRRGSAGTKLFQLTWLSGAVLLARFLSHIKSSLNLENIDCHAWCDSTATLAWIRKPSHTWTTFVANRVSDRRHWYLWWHGPEWLGMSEEYWPHTSTDCTTNIDAKIPTITSLLHIKNAQNDLLQRYSSFHRILSALQRITQIWKHFYKRIVRRINHLDQNNTGWTLCISKHIVYLNSSTCIKLLGKLNPFIDGSEILRVCGRIGHTNIPFNASHPIILPKSCFLTQLLIASAHKINLLIAPHHCISPTELLDNFCLECRKTSHSPVQNLFSS